MTVEGVSRAHRIAPRGGGAEGRPRVQRLGFCIQHGAQSGDRGDLGRIDVGKAIIGSLDRFRRRARRSERYDHRGKENPHRPLSPKLRDHHRA